MSSVKRKREQTEAHEPDNSPKEARIALRQLGPEESLLFAIPQHLLKLIIYEYVCFPYYPALRFVCIGMYNLLPASGKYFVSDMTTRGYFQLAMWAYDKGASFSVYWTESYLKAAQLGNLDAIKWMVSVAKSLDYGVKINTRVFEVFVENRMEDALEFIRCCSNNGQKRYKKAMYLKAILQGDMATVEKLAEQKVRPCRAFLKAAARMDAPEYLAAPFTHELLNTSCLGYNCSIAAKVGSLRFVEWFLGHGFHLNEYFYYAAMEGAQHTLFQQLIANHQFHHVNTLVARHAVYRKDVISLNILAKAGVFPSAYDIVHAAVQKESEDLLIWANAHGLLCDRDVCYYGGYKNSQAPIEWAKQKLAGLGIVHDKWEEPF